MNAMNRVMDPERLIQRALDTTQASGQALIPQLIDPAMVELATLLAPLRSLIPRKPWNTQTYDRPRRTAFGRARSVGDAQSAPSSQSTYSRFQEPLKILQAKGGTTGFMQFASKELLDIAAEEVFGMGVALQFEEESQMVWGNTGADATSLKGLAQWSQGGNSIIVEANGATISTAILDTVIDQYALRGIILDETNSFWLTSPQMISKISAVESATKQRYLEQLNVRGGFRFWGYRNIPFVGSAYLQASQAWTGGTVTPSEQTGGGTGFSVATYRYYVAAVLMTGETLPSAEVSQALAAATNRVRLSWSAPSIAGAVRSYKIYRSAAGGASGTEVLYTEIPGTIVQAEALFGFLTSVDVTSWDDTNVRTTQTTDYANARITGANYTPAAGFATANNDELATGEEDMYLVVTGTPVVSGGPATLIAEGKAMTYLPLAKVSDADNFLIYEYAGMIAVEQVLGRITRVKNS